jgi:hypothetical protein
MGPCTIMDVYPSNVNERFPDAVPVTWARDDLHVSGASAIPCHCEAGAVDRGRHDRLWGRACRPLHTRASHGATRARGRRVVQGGITIQRADQREGTPVCATTPCSRAGAVPGIPHNDALARWKPAHHAGQAESGQRRRRLMARAMGLIPCGVARPGHQQRECPGPDRERTRDQYRHDDPRMPPPIRRIAMGRAHAITMASLAEDVRARAFFDRIISGQLYGSRRHHRVQQQGQQPAGQLPCRPASRRTHPMR